ncbi:MAG TPA: hypothetical protein PKE51_03835 [Gemmatimonadaceae bacterium]|nr:hypothetical protein [Gemmatimonadaceae bacterium]
MIGRVFRAAGRRPAVWLAGVLGGIVLLVLVQQARAAAEDAAARAADLTLSALRDVEVSGELEDASLRETSGLAPSAQVPGLFWTHNDSGNAPTLFVIDDRGRSHGRVTLTGATNRDWEAIAVGPCNAADCVYVGDVGDNAARRPLVTLWRVPEPAVPGPGRTGVAAPVDSLTVRYPDGAHDVEAMWVDGRGDTWLVTKRRLRGPDGTWRRARVYRVSAAAWSAAQPALAELVDSLPHVSTRAERTMITDAAYAPDGRLAIRTYGWVYVFATVPGTGRPQARLAACDLAPLRERQGEALAWRADGRLLFASEGRRAPLYTAHCP